MSLFKISDRQMINYYFRKFQVHSYVITVLFVISGHFTKIPKPELLAGIWGKKNSTYPTHRQKKEDGLRVTNQDLLNTYSYKRRLICPK